jgi:hypothetical protein
MQPSGAPAVADDDAGALVGQQGLGAYGTERSSWGTPWTTASFDGVPHDAAGEVLEMGVRHLLRRDGQRLQPEPVLRSGIPLKMLEEPLARNSPFSFVDRDGLDPEPGDAPRWEATPWCEDETSAPSARSPGSTRRSR